MPHAVRIDRGPERPNPVWIGWILVVILLLPSANQAAEPPRTDRLGDPLSEGAVTRLGTARLRHEVVAHSAIPLAFTADGRYLASSDGGTIYLWEAHTGRAVWRWTARDWGDVRRLVGSPDGKTHEHRLCGRCQ